jgi:signal transduction histidine kinase
VTLLRRWTFLVLGGALFTPYALLALVALPLAAPSLAEGETAPLLVAALALVIVAICATAMLPVVRTAEAVLVPMLLGGPADDLVVMPARTWDERLRGGLWWVLHTVVGAVVSLATVVVPPLSVNLIAGTVAGDPSIPIGEEPTAVDRAWAIPLAVGLLAGLVVVAWLCGLAAARSAPWLLGPNPAVRLAELERRTVELTERARLARELHDSLGHALTVTTLQASAARRVLRSDPEFVETALEAIEQTGRVAAAELDNVLGLLREESQSRAPQPTLGDLDALLASHRQAGLPVSAATDDDLDVEPVVSREVYRVVQEGLTNVHRHAGSVPTTVTLTIANGRLTAGVRNEPGRRTTKRTGGGRTGGGHGIDGLRERVRLLGGSVDAGPDERGGWLLVATVPTGRKDTDG